MTIKTTYIGLFIFSFKVEKNNMIMNEGKLKEIIDKNLFRDRWNKNIELIY